MLKLVESLLEQSGQPSQAESYVSFEMQTADESSACTTAVGKVSVGTQTHSHIIFKKDAATSTHNLIRRTSVYCQANFPKEKVKNVSFQYPSPKKTKKFLQSTFRAESVEEEPGYNTFIAGISNINCENDSESSSSDCSSESDLDSELDSTVNNELNITVNNELNITVNKELETVNTEPVNNEFNVTVNGELNETILTESEIDDHQNDTDYTPSEIDNSTESSCDESEVLDPKIAIRNERTLLVYESKLYELLRFCPNCGSHLDQSLIEEVKNMGSQLHLKISCFKNCSVEWKSQPTVGSLKGLGNIFLASSIAFSGLPLAKFQRFAWLVNLKFISDSVYYQLRRDFILPTVRQKWNVERKNMVKLLRSRDLVVLVGDGRCDSPGHSAKYCTYTFMETKTSRVIDTVDIPVTEVKNSNAMEKAGFIKILSGLKKEGVKVDIVSTDKHTQIRKLMRVDPNFNTIKHQFDPWHIAKSVCKKLHKASKKKAKESLIEWIPAIVNHFWWSVSTCNNDPQLLYEKCSSIMFHIVNKHEWPGCKLFKKCAHAPLTREDGNRKKWLEEGSEAHQYIVSLVKNKQMKDDCNYLTEVISMTNVEVFNNLLLKYIPKQYHFEYDHMVMGTYLTALDKKFNCERLQDTIRTGVNAGKYKYKIAWRKPTQKLIARKVYTAKRYDYLKVMMSSIYKRVEQVYGAIRKRRSGKHY